MAATPGIGAAGAPQRVELGDDGRIYDTALVFDPHGELVAWHRKVHLYPPTLEPSVFSAGDRGIAVVDILRVEGCKVVEHWDVVQPVPEKSVNSNGML